MNPTLRNMFLVVGVALTGGTLYGIALLKSEFTPQNAADAGLLTISVPGRVSCRVRVKDSCRALPDGGLRPRYARLGLRARIVRDAGLGGGLPPIVAIDVPNAWQPCLTVVGSTRDSCDVVENGSCTVPAICNAGADPQPEADTCACRPAAGVCTRADGGVAPFGVTMRPGTFTGAACVAKFCGPELAGEQGLSWPSQCPQ